MAVKARGKKLGSKNLSEIRKRGTASNQIRARARAANILPIIERIKASGAVTLDRACAQRKGSIRSAWW
jgi:hypothetical protein